MNERIKELTEQANAFARETIEYSRAEDFDIFVENLYRASYEKFAELIIKECTNMLPEDSIRNKDGVHMYYVIREHFGVTLVRGDK